MRFDYDFFINIIKMIQHQGYTFCRFDQPGISGHKTCYLRHDVDISPYSAIKMGELEYAMGIKANYFFQIGAETYNIFNPRVVNIMRQLRNNEHCVGLHLDKTASRDEQVMLNTYKWFNSTITKIDRVVSFHQPTQEALFKKLQNSLISAYSSDFFAVDCYFSDSRRNIEFYSRLEKWLKEDRAILQILLHPEWWYPEADKKRFAEILIERKTLELKEYLKNDLGNYFGDVFDKDDYVFKI